MKDLHLNVKGIYFDQIKAGTKIAEFRLANEYWRKRLHQQEYRWVFVKRGYPKRGDTSRILKFPYRGYSEEKIKHPHFGNKFVNVFAIELRRDK